MNCESAQPVCFYVGPNGYDKVTSQLPCAAWLMKVVGSHHEDSDDESGTPSMTRMVVENVDHKIESLSVFCKVLTDNTRTQNKQYHIQIQSVSGVEAHSDITV